MEEKSSGSNLTKPKNQNLKVNNSTIARLLAVASPVIGLVKVGKEFNSLKIVALCFAAILVVNNYESHNKISTANANTAVNTLSFLSGAAVVLEQYLDLVNARQRQKKKTRN